MVPGVRALVLAAGRGSRLRPLSNGLAKPLLPVLGEPLVERTLARLASAGVEAVALNLHHLAADIRERLSSSTPRLSITYSCETELLGTLGALHPLADFLGTAELVLVVNGDTLCDWPFEEMLEQHRERRPRATLLLTEQGDPDAFGPVGVDAEGRVVSLPGGAAPAGSARGAVTKRVFAGAHVLSPELVRRAREEFSGIVSDLYVPLLAAGERLDGLTSGSPWHDLGTPRRYLDAVLDWAARGPQRDPRGNWVASAARVDESADLERVIVEAGARLEAGVTASGSLVLGAARVGREASIRDAIVAPGVELPAGSRMAHQMVTPGAWGTSRRSSREGKLVFTSLG